jgi:hypothetical protein
MRPARAIALALWACACGAQQQATPEPAVDAAAASMPVVGNTGSTGNTGNAGNAATTPDAPVAASVDLRPAAPAPDAARDAATQADAAPASDAGGAPVAGVRDCKSARTCEDFESYAMGTPPAGPWKVTADNGGTAIVDGTKAFSGTRSLHITTQGGGGRGFLTQGKPLLPIDGNNMYGRFMMFFVEPPTGTHFGLVKAPGMVAGGTTAIYAFGGLDKAYVLFNYSPGGSVRISKTSWPANRWSCVQWQFDGSKNEARIWLDGQLLSDVVVSKAGGLNWPAPVFDSLTIGFEPCCPTPVKVQMWIDELAIDSRPVECPR